MPLVTIASMAAWNKPSNSDPTTVAAMANLPLLLHQTQMEANRREANHPADNLSTKYQILRVGNTGTASVRNRLIQWLQMTKFGRFAYKEMKEKSFYRKLQILPIY